MKFLGLVYLGLCLAAIVLLVAGTIITDIRWRLRQRKRGLPMIDPRSRPQP